MKPLTTEQKIDFFNQAELFHGVSIDTITKLALITRDVSFPKGTIIARNGELCDKVFIVFDGLLRVSACSSSGKRITYLLVNKGEPFNILSPFAQTSRFYEAEAIKDAHCLTLKNSSYISFLESHPDIITPIFKLVTRTLDSAVSRSIDLVEKKVEVRIMRILRTLDAKFGSPLHFTSVEISELAGTTPESTLRAMGTLRDMGAIETQRGKIWLRKPETLMEFGEENMAF